MKYCIVILLSKNAISFLYNRDDGADCDKLLPFDSDKVGMPLAIYCSDDTIEISRNAYEEAKKNTPNAYYNIFEVIRKNRGFSYRGENHSSNKLLYFAIEKYLADFFYSVMFQQVGTLEQNRSTLPVGFIFEADVESKERTFVITTFKNGGYNNVAEIDYHVSLLKVILLKGMDREGNHTRSALVVSSDGMDLFCDLYQLADGCLIKSLWMKDRGYDPRVSRVVDTIWKDVMAFNYNLKKEEELELLKREAKDFLDSGKSELEGCVRLSDGRKYDFFVSRRSIENYSLASDTQLLPDIQAMLCQAAIDPEDCMVVLRNKTVGNSFFREVFGHRFSMVCEETSEIREAIMKCILSDIKQGGYDLSRKTGKAAFPEIGRSFTEDSVGEAAVPPETWKQYEREVKGTMAEAGSDMRKQNFEKAKRRLDELLDDLAKEGIHAFDSKILALGKEILALEKKWKESALRREKVVKPDPKVNVAEWRRKEREARTMAKISMRKGDWEGAAGQLRDLLRELDRQGLSEWGAESVLLLKECEERSLTPVATGTSPERVGTSPSKGYELLKKKEFIASKRAFTKEGNVEMAKTCSKLGQISIRVTEVSKKLSLETKRGRESLQELCKELAGYKGMYQHYGLDTNELDRLIRILKKSSNH